MTLSYSTLRYSCSGFGSCLSLSTVWIAKQPNQSHIIKVFKRNWSFSLKAVDTKIWMPRLLLYFLSYFLTVGEVSHCTKSCCSTKSPLHLGGDLCMSDLHHCYYSVCDGMAQGEEKGMCSLKDTVQSIHLSGLADSECFIYIFISFIDHRTGWHCVMLNLHELICSNCFDILILWNTESSSAFYWYVISMRRCGNKVWPLTHQMQSF